ncbi:hypothetical protein [Janthinobacterium sp. CAN_S7]|uniref:hypothetical protein n=1 Tax=Janthinobacterium sp. CAN_S7 TaxID=3071704 RepID=UPI00319DD6D0
MTSARTPVRKVLLRTITLFGGDRRIIGSAGLGLAVVGIANFKGYGFFYGIPFVVPTVIFMIALWAAREANKSDPWMVDIWSRQLKYRKYYGAKPDLGIGHPQVVDFN